MLDLFRILLAIGFVNPIGEKKICMLMRSIYGLKQASWNCMLRFDETTHKFGVLRNLTESCG